MRSVVIINAHRNQSGEDKLKPQIYEVSFTGTVAYIATIQEAPLEGGETNITGTLDGWLSG